MLTRFPLWRPIPEKLAERFRVCWCSTCGLEQIAAALGKTEIGGDFLPVDTLEYLKYKPDTQAVNKTLPYHVNVGRFRMRTMLILVASAFIGIALLCGCGKKSELRFRDGNGDAGQFILNQVVSRGGQPVTTNGLPLITGAWRFAEDQYGVVVHLSRSDYESVEKLLRQAFGEPKFGPSETTDGGKLGGYRLTPQGGAIQFGYDSDGAQVIILRQLTQPEAEVGLTRAL